MSCENRCLYKKNTTTQKFMSGEREAMNYRYMIGDQVIIEYMPQRFIDELIDSYIEAHDLKRILGEY